MATGVRGAMVSAADSLKVILAGDVGGTHARLAFMQGRGGELSILSEKIYPSHGYSKLEDIVADFLKQNSLKPELAGIGVAGPVRDGKCVATNLPWIVDSIPLAAACGLPRVELLNDLEANAYGIATLATADFATLQKGIPNAQGNAAVISAGKGLGEAGMYFDGKTLRPFAGEGGHASFAPEGEVQAELFEYLMRKFGHVSCERVLSGPGLVNIYEFLRDTGRGPENHAVVEQMRSGDPAAAISNAALKDACQLCDEAVEIFVQIYGGGGRQSCVESPGYRRSISWRRDRAENIERVAAADFCGRLSEQMADETSFGSHSCACNPK